MSGISKECQRISFESPENLGGHKRRIQYNADREGAAKIRGRMGMAMSVVMIVVTVMIVRHVKYIALICGHDDKN